MTAEPKPLPKSLHTVTVLVQFARVLWAYRTGYSRADTIDAVIRHLGLEGRPDTHGLRAAALKQLENDQ